MIKTTIISIVLIFQISTNYLVNSCACDILYQGACVTFECQIKIQRLTTLQAQPNEGEQSTLKVDQQLVYDSLANLYISTLTWLDDINDPILDSNGECLSYQLYFTKNSQDIDPTRLYISYASQTPTTPQTQYQLSENQSIVTTKLTFKDIQNSCVLLENEDYHDYLCNMELTFQLRSITQASYYYQFNVQIQKKITGNSFQAINFTKTVEQNTCQDDSKSCAVQITVTSKVLFCSDEQCLETSETPFIELTLGTVFYMIHEIQESSFDTWYLIQPIISYQATGYFYQSFGNDELNLMRVVQQQQGKTILKLMVPSVYANVVVTILAKLSPTLQVVENSNRILQTTPDNLIARFQINIKQIKDDDEQGQYLLMLSIFTLLGFMGVI